MHSPPLRDRQQTAQDSGVVVRKSGHGTAHATPAFAPPARLARLQALMHASTRSAAQLKFPANQASGVMQLEAAKVAISGSTHLVSPHESGSLIGGREAGLVRDGDLVKIERDGPLKSARGPHHDTGNNKDLDVHNEEQDVKNYTWFKVLKVNGKAPKKEAYLRDETFIYVDQAQHLEDDAVETNLSAAIKADNMTDAYVKAHGLGNANDITAGQAAYQNWLKSKYSDGEIMDTHRSVGFEYEFATFTGKKGKDPGVPAHVKLGESSVLSPLFNMPFTLESDNSNELEAITPPLLVADSANEINMGAANRIYGKYKRALEALRNGTPIGTKLSTVDYSAAGLGNGWAFKSLLSKLFLATRGKHKDTPGSIHAQMNMSLTAEEIAAFTQPRTGGRTAGYGAVVDAYSAVHPVLDAKRGPAVLKAPLEMHAALTKSIDAANVNLAKGLAGLVTIPSILARGEGRDQENTLYTSVKEYCGIWLKDSIPNIVDNTLRSPEARSTMRDMLADAAGEITAQMDAVVKGVLQEMENDNTKTFRKGKGKGKERLADYERKYSEELASTLGAILSRLESDLPEQKDTPPAPAYGKEKFGTSGLGVRKDTFVNIKSGNQRALHLAELRSNYALEKLLGVGRRQR